LPAAPIRVCTSNTFEGEHPAGLLKGALERFYDAYPSFMREIEKDLDIGPNISKEELREHQAEIFVLFGMSCVRMEIIEVYPGKKYHDTCLSEVNTLFD
jgi:hypothetical protein